MSKPAAAFFVAVTCVLGVMAMGPALAAEGDTVATQSTSSDTIAPEATVPDVTIPGSADPETSVAEPTDSGTTVPSTTVPSPAVSSTTVSSETVSTATPVSSTTVSSTTSAPEVASTLPTTDLSTDQSPADGLPEVFAIEENRPPSANDLFITEAYRELLQRPVDQGGAAFWLNSIVAGGDRSREILTNKLLFSPEGASNEVVEAYADLLNRFPDQSGWDHWNVLLQTHRVDELRVLIMTSDEYILINGGPSNYVNSLYIELLGRPAEASGLAFWQSELDRGVPRKVIVDAIYRSDEGLGGRTNAYYQRFVGRSATGAERSAGVALIRADGERTLAANIFASDESFEAFFDAALDPLFVATATIADADNG